MTHRFTALFISLFLTFPLIAQCDLAATVSEVECDIFGDSFTFRLTITGGDSLVRFAGIGLELPLPVDETFTAPSGLGAFDVILESGSRDSICQTIFTLTPPEDCVPSVPDCTVNIEEQNDVCGAPETLLAQASGSAPFTYVWSTGDTTASIGVLEGVWGYSVTVTNSDSCVSVSNAHIFGRNGFNVYVTSAGTPCEDNAGPTLTASVHGGQSPFTYAWSNGETTQSIIVAMETEYTVTVTDANGCTASNNGLYHPGSFADHLSISGPTSTSCEGSPITLSIDNPNPNFEYRWINGSDTLRGSSVEITSGGNFDVRGFDPERPACQSLGWYSVADASVMAEDLRIVDLSEDGCTSEHGCFGVFSTSRSLNFYPSEVTWTLDGNPRPDLFGQFICVTDFGDYLATVVTPCDTIEVGFTFAPVTGCTEVCGSVVMDDDQNCDEDGNVIDWSGIVALLVNIRTGVVYPVHLNPDGSFCAQVPDDKYAIQVLNDLMTISTDCEVIESRMTLEGDVTDMLLFARTFVEGAGSAGSETTSLSGSEAEMTSLQVYPNPNDGRFNVQLSTEEEGTTNFTLYDLTGRQIWRATNATLSFEQPDLLPAGVYILSAELGTGKRITQRVVVR